jgi:hypothetical protein
VFIPVGLILAGNLPYNDEKENARLKKRAIPESKATGVCRTRKSLSQKGRQIIGGIWIKPLYIAGLGPEKNGAECGRFNRPWAV